MKQKNYFLKMHPSKIVSDLSDSVKKSYPGLSYLIVDYYKCSSDSTVTPIFEKNEYNSENTDITKKDSSPLFTIVEQMPECIGGNIARNRFLSENIHYPQSALKNGIQGTVYVHFIIEKDGSISDIKVLKGIGGGCDEEAIRVLSIIPKWIPGRQNGKTVRVLFNTPISFSLKS